MKLAYLCCPYTSSNPQVCADRVEAADWFAAALMADGFSVFSPISHGHRVAQHLDPGLSDSHAFWMNQSIDLLRRCDELFLLPLEGWGQSRGVGIELDFAASAGIPIHVIQSSLFGCISFKPQDFLLSWKKYDLHT